LKGSCPLGAIGTSRSRFPKIRTCQDAATFAGEVLRKTAAGETTPSEAADLGKLIENFVRALETTDTERRLAELEQQQRGPQQRSTGSLLNA